MFAHVWMGGKEKGDGPGQGLSRAKNGAVEPEDGTVRVEVFILVQMATTPSKRAFKILN
jgi:hypothetical protein